MADIENDFVSEADLGAASEAVTGDLAQTLQTAGATPEAAQAQATQTAAKLDRRLALLMRRPAAEGDSGAGPRRIRTIITYRPKPSRDFESVLAQIAASLGRPRSESRDEPLNLTSEELAGAFPVVESAAELSAEGLLAQIEREGGQLVEHLRLADAVVAELTPAQITALAAREDVERLETDRPIFTELRDSTRTILVNAAREQGFVREGAGIIVAVLDGEVSDSHPDLAGRVVRKRNYSQEGWGRPSRHGTHVAGIIAGAGPEFRGVAPGATIWNYKLFPTGEAESVAASGQEAAEGSTGADAIEDAVKDGAKVINCSWGIGGVTMDGSSVWARAAERATKLGVVLVKSAGNAGPDAGTLTTPADAKGDVIVVGAVSRDGSEVTSFSSRGPTADGRNKPDICAPGDKIMSASDSGQGYRALSGTSMAAPHVAGLAALLLERNPGWKPAQVKAALMDHADLMTAGDTGADSQGRGRANLLRAVGGAAAPPGATPPPADPADPAGEATATVAQALRALRDEVAALRQDVAALKKARA